MPTGAGSTRTCTPLSGWGSPPQDSRQLAGVAADLRDLALTSAGRGKQQQPKQQWGQNHRGAVDLEVLSGQMHRPTNVQNSPVAARASGRSAAVLAAEAAGAEVAAPSLGSLAL